MNTTPAIVELKPFIPAHDFLLSLQFYRALGFDVVWQADAMASLKAGAAVFLLQDFKAPGHAENTVMHLWVEDADVWWAHVQASGVLAFAGVRAEPPRDQPWGQRDFVLIDPAGVLWRIGAPLAPSAASLPRPA